MLFRPRSVTERGIFFRRQRNKCHTAALIVDRFPIYRVPDEVNLRREVRRKRIHRAALDVSIMLTRNSHIASHSTHVCVARETLTSHLLLLPPPLLLLAPSAALQ